MAEGNLKDPPLPTDMAGLRRVIDGLDEDLVALLVKRFACMRQAAAVKPVRADIYDARRKREVLTHVEASAKAAGADADAVAAIIDIYRNIIGHSIAYEFTAFDRLQAEAENG